MLDGSFVLYIIISLLAIAGGTYYGYKSGKQQGREEALDHVQGSMQRMTVAALDVVQSSLIHRSYIKYLQTSLDAHKITYEKLPEDDKKPEIVSDEKRAM